MSGFDFETSFIFSLGGGRDVRKKQLMAACREDMMPTLPAQALKNFKGAALFWVSWPRCRGLKSCRTHDLGGFDTYESKRPAISLTEESGLHVAFSTWIPGNAAAVQWYFELLTYGTSGKESSMQEYLTPTDDRWLGGRSPRIRISQV